MRQAVLWLLLITGGMRLQAAGEPSNPAAPPGSPLSILNRSLPSWVRFTGELRAREEGFLANRFSAGQDDMYLLQRVRLAVSLQPLPWLGMFVQGQDSRVSFTDRINAAPPYQDSADLRQAWVQLGRGEDSTVSLRIGRQELAFGEERLVGASNWGNVARSFDAVRLGLRHGGYQATAFASSVVVPKDHVFDRHVDGDNLHGIYGSIDSWLPRGTVEPYVFWHVAPRIQSEAGRQAQLNHKTTGIRLAGQLPQAFEYTSEIALQRGSWGGDSVAAWAGYWRIVRSFNDQPWQPRVRLEFNHASGDANPADERHGTFEVLYPTPHDKYGLADQVGWKNINHVGLTGEFRPTKTLVLQAKAHDWWLASPHDGLYSAGGALLVRDRTGMSGTHVGEELDVQVSWTPMPGLQLAGGVGRMFAGEFLNRTTPGHAYTFPYVTLVYGF